jgi:DNA-binding transcriptional regulator LsrR (DeoR family)
MNKGAAVAEPDSRRGAGWLESAVVARMYYIEDRQKNEIAQELGISRFKVARLLEDARASGIVKISVDMPAEVDIVAGDILARRYGIQRAVVVRSPRSPTAVRSVIGQAAADYLATMRPGTTLGISWGSTLTAVVDAVQTIPEMDVVQLVGGSTMVRPPDSGVELVRRLSERTGGRAVPLHAPLLVRTADMAQQLRSDPSLFDVFSRFDHLDAALVGVGSWNPIGSSLWGELSDSEREELVEAGAAGDLCSLVFDESGALLDSPALRRSVGITGAELRAVPDVVAVAGGRDKVSALEAVLRSGIVNTLITDTSAAEELIAR